jgi:hypothetical protein
VKNRPLTRKQRGDSQSFSLALQKGARSAKRPARNVRRSFGVLAKATGWGEGWLSQYTYHQWK